MTDDYEAPAAVTASFVKMRTLTDGTVRLEIDLDGGFAAAAGLNLLPGAPLAVARLAQEAAAEHGRKQMIRSGGDSFYAKLHRDGFFINPNVVSRLGTDEQYREWIQRQPSVISGQFSEYVHGEGRSIACHVRRVNLGAGMAEKPPFACVPMTDREHQLQHLKGESYFPGGAAFFDKKRAELLTKWAKQQVYDQFGVASLSDIEVTAFCAWAHDLGIGNYLPKRGQ